MKKKKQQQRDSKYYYRRLLVKKRVLFGLDKVTWLQSTPDTWPISTSQNLPCSPSPPLLPLHTSTLPHPQHPHERHHTHPHCVGLHGSCIRQRSGQISSVFVQGKKGPPPTNRTFSETEPSSQVRGFMSGFVLSQRYRVGTRTGQKPGINNDNNITLELYCPISFFILYPIERCTSRETTLVAFFLHEWSEVESVDSIGLL